MGVAVDRLMAAGWGVTTTWGHRTKTGSASAVCGGTALRRRLVTTFFERRQGLQHQTVFMLASPRNDGSVTGKTSRLTAAALVCWNTIAF